MWLNFELPFAGATAWGKKVFTMKQKRLLGLMFSLLCGVWAYAQQGLVGEYYNGKSFNELKMTRTDTRIDFNWARGESPAAGLVSDDFSVRWKGKIQAPKTGKYMFRAKVDDGIRVKIDGQMVINAWGMHDSEKFIGAATLTAGRLYELEVEYFNGLFEGEIHLFWQLPGEEPLLGGLWGYNDKPIDSRYYFQPEAKPARPAEKPVTPARTTKPSPKPLRSPRVEDKPAPKPPAPTVEKPAPKPVVLPADTLALYIPQNIFFERSKTVILPESLAELDQLATFLLRNPKLKLTIEGHTDRLGDPAQNLKLSQLRTKKVARYLEQKGVSPERLTAIGYGGSRPLIKGDSKTEIAKNRRVEFVLSE